MEKRNILEKMIVPIFMIVYSALFILLVFSVSFHWAEMVQNSFMFVLLTMSLTATIYPLVKKGKIDILESVFVVICVLLLVVAIIVFVSLATDKYKEAVVQISAAFVGGMISLYGIGLTIKYNRLEKEKSDIEKAKPNVFPIGQEIWNSIQGMSKITRNIEIRADLSSLDKAKKGEDCYSFAPIYLANSDQSMCTIKGIIINNSKFVVFQYDNILLKGGNYCLKIDYDFKVEQSIDSIQLILGDMIGNTYGCYMSFVIGEKNKSKRIPIHIMGSLKLKSFDTNKYKVFQAR